MNVAEVPSRRNPTKALKITSCVNTHRHSLRTLAILNGTCVNLGTCISMQGKKEVGKQRYRFPHQKEEVTPAVLNLKDSYQDNMKNYIPSDLQQKIITNV